MKYRILSYPVDENIPVYGSTPKPTVNPYRQISRGDRSNSYIITIHNHTGTHVDAPRHFIPDGRPISDYAFDDFIFNNPLLIDCPKDPGELIELEDVSAQSQLDGVDFLLFRTGFGRFRDKDQEIYRTHNPGISPDVILWLRKEFPAVRCIGIDSLSISSFQHRERGREAHTTAFIKREGLGEPLLLVEDMDLNTLSTDDKLKRVIFVPWQISGVDSAPCIVLVEVINDEEA
jgi:kynurenine formamidase